MDLLVEHAAQAGRVDAKPDRLHPAIGIEVQGSLGMAVNVILSAGHTRR